jgi:hypothetical protein
VTERAFTDATFREFRLAALRVGIPRRRGSQRIAKDAYTNTYRKIDDQTARICNISASHHTLIWSR